MTLRETFNKYRTYYNYGVGVLFLFFALIGLILFSLEGITKGHFEAIYFLINTAITLAGFTMLSGIFEGKRTKTQIERQLFFLSILFLVSAFLLIFFIGISSSVNNATNINGLGRSFWIIILVFTYFFGVFLFFMGFAFLIFVLIQHYSQIGASPNAWWKFWK